MYQLRGMHHCPGRDLENIQEEVKRMRKLRNVVLPLLLVMVLVVGSCLPVCAADYGSEFTVENVSAFVDDTIELCRENGLDISLYPYMAIVEDYSKGNSKMDYLIISDKPLYCYKVLGRPNVVCILEGTNAITRRYGFNFYTSYSSVSSNKKIVDHAYHQLAATNHEIYYTDLNTWEVSEDFFLQNRNFFPKKVRLLEVIQITIPEMQTILKEIIGMIPLLIPLLAGYLGLRKAWSLISRTLRVA